jgi:hypothetical protein
VLHELKPDALVTLVRSWGVFGFWLFVERRFRAESLENAHYILIRVIDAKTDLEIAAAVAREAPHDAAFEVGKICAPQEDVFARREVAPQSNPNPLTTHVAPRRNARISGAVLERYGPRQRRAPRTPSLW